MKTLLAASIAAAVLVSSAGPASAHDDADHRKGSQRGQATVHHCKGDACVIGSRRHHAWVARRARNPHAYRAWRQEQRLLRKKRRMQRRRPFNYPQVLFREPHRGLCRSGATGRAT